MRALSGFVWLNSTAIMTDSLVRIRGYVQHDDLFMGCLTVIETLTDGRQRSEACLGDRWE